VSIHRAADIERFIKLAEEYDLNVVLAGVEEGWMVADKIFAAGMAVIIDPSRNLPSSYDALGSRLENAALMHKAGVKLIFTGIGWQNTHNAYLVRQAAGLAVANGLPKQEAIAAITSNPMTLFSQNTLSSEIREGAVADFVMWQGDPLEVTSEAVLVYIDGQKMPMVSRSTRLRDRYFKRLKNMK
ncbi:MAG TPA: imidazolonepropionase, partial [Aeromonadales bacterium]|nr:imidazolonepropionase [Aeromonadales bacterium]